MLMDFSIIMEEIVIRVNMICKTVATFAVVIAHFLVALATGQTLPKLESRSWSSEEVTEKKKIPVRMKPVALLKDGQATSGISTKHLDILPPWFNSTLFKTGQLFAQKNFFAVYLGPIYVFNIFLSFPDSKSMLVFTSKSDTKEKSKKRYLAAMLHMKLWFEEMATGSEKISPFLLESLNNVREIHYKVAKNTKDKTPYQAKSRSTYKIDEKFWAAVQKDLANSNIPLKSRNYPKDLLFGTDSKSLNHLVMSLTQWFLAGPSVLHPERSGIHDSTEEELLGWNHFWAVICYILGMEDEYNVALHPNVESARTYYKDILDSYFLPSLFQMDDDAKILWETFFTSFSEAFLGPNGSRLVKKEHFMILALEQFHHVKATHIRSTLSQTDLGVNSVLAQIVRMMRYAPVRNTVNSLVRKYYFEETSKKVFGTDMKSREDIVAQSYA